MAQVFGVVVPIRGQADHVAGKEEAEDLSAAVGEDAVARDDALDDLVDILGLVAVEEQAFGVVEFDHGLKGRRCAGPNEAPSTAIVSIASIGSASIPRSPWLSAAMTPRCFGNVAPVSRQCIRL